MSSIESFFRGGLSAAIALGWCLATAPVSADIHRCIGAGGHVTYTDQGCPAAANASHLPDDLQGQPDPLAPAAPASTPVSYQTATSSVADVPGQAGSSKNKP